MQKIFWELRATLSAAGEAALVGAGQHELAQYI